MRIDQLPVASAIENADTLPFSDGGTTKQISIGNLTNSIRDNVYGAPLTASTSSDITDTSRIYVYTGTTDGGFTNGHWYYYNGSAWTDGGIYNSAAVQTDPTLTLEGVPADAKAVGDAITTVKSSIMAVYASDKAFAYNATTHTLSLPQGFVEFLGGSYAINSSVLNLSNVATQYNAWVLKYKHASVVTGRYIYAEPYMDYVYDGDPIIGYVYGPIVYIGGIPSNRIVVSGTLKILEQPVNQIASIGMSATFSIVAENVQSYQWEASVNNGNTWVALSGATNSTYSLEVTNLRLTYLFRVRMVGTDGTTMLSDVAKIIEGSVEIIQQPVSAIASIGGQATFSVDALRAQSYQWEASINGGADWVALNDNSTQVGAQTSTYSLNVTSLRLTYLFRVRVAGYDGTEVISDVVHITEEMYVYCFGDSITAGSGSSILYHMIFHQWKPLAHFYNWGVGGSGYAKNGDSNASWGGGVEGDGSTNANPGNSTVLDMMRSITNTMHYIMIFAGTNDFGSNRGIEAFRTAVQNTLDYAQSITPHVFVITPLKRDFGGYTWKTVNAVGATLTDYRDIIIAECESRGIVYADGYNISIDPINSISKTAFAPDGIHPNVAGHARIARYLWNWLLEAIGK